MTEQLFAKYGEISQLLGVDSRGSLLVAYVNPTTLTWTLVAVMPDGVACMITSGEDWRKTEMQETPL